MQASIDKLLAKHFSTPSFTKSYQQFHQQTNLITRSHQSSSLLIQEKEDTLEGEPIVEPEQNIVIYYFNLQITVKDIELLEEPNWFNDTIIDFYITYVLKTQIANTHKMKKDGCSKHM